MSLNEINDAYLESKMLSDEGGQTQVRYSDVLKS